ncbi:MAG: biotin--[acetyl-CoA-carboxylase] ligase [Candidatus Cloacimonetes bacterium]|jgi:BirA family transcriptional regulator, biotin operon repressor / biotin---[acetyl-CoA-carboxylase] ligase|nr:biotin--[acetyl-CoA-carboxylase] ligase [Candidatus Cloacimonadota bacterium]MBT6994843.1 biotin--[acetyl-CoA-carboxylase] ligase [Candidatus Cloacimonadota bacterium]MBT7469209.1 biotin--[acetyl-CoA-carboxylase] ligase [Candidatus Cloacimonadota bacterium]
MEKFTHKLFDEIIELKSINSTSKFAEKLIKNKEINGNFLVISETQTAGKGRNKNSWFSPEGGIWMTAALYSLPSEMGLTIFMGNCIHRAISELFPKLKLQIKWPNDIFLENEKLCGILSSQMSYFNYHLIGIGINTNVEKFAENLNAISLKNVVEKKVQNNLIIEKIFEIFTEDFPFFIENGIDVKYFQKFDYLKGKKVVLDTDFDRFEGVVKGINKTGAILLKLKSGMIQPFYAGSILTENEI